MFLRNFRKSAALVLGAGIVSLMMTGCGGTDGASGIGPVAPPVAGELVTIDAANADKVLASTVGGIGKIAGMIDGVVDNLPGLGTTDSKIASTSAVASDTLALSLVSRECSDGGSISVDGVSTSGGSVTFKDCQERGVLLNGSAKVSVVGGSYDIEFTDFGAVFSTGTLYLSSAGATVDGSYFAFAIASGTATVQGIEVEIKNFTLSRDGSGTVINSSIRTDCMGGWVDVATTIPLAFDGSDLLIGGEFSITGSTPTSMRVTVIADGSVNVLVNDVLYANYSSAADLPQYNAVCP